MFKKLRYMHIKMKLFTMSWKTICLYKSIKDNELHILGSATHGQVNNSPVKWRAIAYAPLIFWSLSTWTWKYKKYRRSPVSAVFEFPANRTIGKTALIGDWFSTKIAIWDFWIFKVLFFCSFPWNFSMIVRFTLTCLLSYLSQILTSWQNFMKF